PVNQLDILNVSANYLSHKTIARLSELDVQLIATHQKSEDHYTATGDRYCSVSE
ncbi:MAG: HEAT repeat domain-containing protein, partial [Coleofasciculus sp. Co-bin14]|nr:HEAT repeat domain-containing protein [Coleofasciculus sp. Co-bin14]